MRTWKNYLCMLAALVVTLGFTSCESDEDIGFDLSGLYGVTWFGDMGAGDTGESIIIDYPHVNGNYFYGTIGNFDFRLEYDGGRSVKRQADISK